MTGFITVKFTADGQAEFDIKTSEPAQLFTALLGIEGYAGRITGLGSSEIRSILDEMKDDVDVKPVAVEDVEDIEPEIKNETRNSGDDGSEEHH